MVDIIRMVRSAAVVGSLTAGAAAGVGVAIVNRNRQEGVNLAFSMGGDLSLAIAGIEMNVHGEENLWAARPAVFTFNHQSQLDVPVVAALLRRDFTGVAKKSLEANPIFGPMGKFAGVAFIDRGDPAKARAALEPAVANLRKGISLAVAPEGTRSVTLGPFKKGPFHMAMQGGVPMVPIVIRNASDIMEPHSYVIKPGVVDVAVLPPVDTSSWVPENVDEYRDQVHQMYVDTLSDWPS